MPFPERLKQRTATTEDLMRLGDLIQIQLFKGLTESNIETLIKSCSVLTVECNQQFPLNSTAPGMYLILEGYVVISAESLLMRNMNFLAWRGPGQIFGEMMIIGAEPVSRNANEAIVKTCDKCELLVMPSSIFTELANSTPHIYRNIARLLMQKIYQERDRLEILQMKTTVRRVAQAILNLYSERGCDENRRGQIIKGRILRDHLAGYIGRRQESVSRAIAELKDMNIIRYSKGKITIRQLDRLRSISRDGHREDT